MVEGRLWIEVFLNRSVCFINPQILPPQLLKQAAFIILGLSHHSSPLTNPPVSYLHACTYPHVLMYTDCSKANTQTFPHTWKTTLAKQRTILHFTWEYNPHHHLICVHHTAASFLFVSRTHHLCRQSSYEAPDTAFMSRHLGRRYPCNHITLTSHWQYTHGTKPHLWRKMTTIWLLLPHTKTNTHTHNPPSSITWWNPSNPELQWPPPRD